MNFEDTNTINVKKLLSGFHYNHSELTCVGQISNRSQISLARTEMQGGNLVRENVEKILVSRDENAETQNSRKRRRRHFVEHRYHDHAQVKEDPRDNIPNRFLHSQGTERPKRDSKKQGGWSMTFPEKLHLMLDEVEREGLAWVISWQPHGRAFLVHHREEFVNGVMPKYFNQTKLTSFHRQLNLYGFLRITRGADAGAYYHELFLQGKPFLCKRMVRFGIKGTGVKASTSPATEPDFYKMTPVLKSQVEADGDQAEKAPFPQYPFSDFLGQNELQGGKMTDAIKKTTSSSLGYPVKIDVTESADSQEMEYGRQINCHGSNSVFNHANCFQANNLLLKQQSQQFGFGRVNVKDKIEVEESSLSTLHGPSSFPFVSNSSNAAAVADPVVNVSLTASDAPRMHVLGSSSERVITQSNEKVFPSLDSLDPLSLLLRHTFGDDKSDGYEDDNAQVSTITSNCDLDCMPRCEQLKVFTPVDVPAEKCVQEGYCDESSQMSDSELGNLLDIICDDL